jgi:hypothetical protein
MIRLILKQVLFGVGFSHLGSADSLYAKSKHHGKYAKFAYKIDLLQAEYVFPQAQYVYKFHMKVNPTRTTANQEKCYSKSLLIISVGVVIVSHFP